MTEPPDLATLLRKHICERFDNKGSQALARSVNERFTEQPGVDFLTRNTIDNWSRGYVKNVREWEKLAAVAAVLGLDEPAATELLHAAGQLSLAEKRLRAERAIEQKILACWPDPSSDRSGTTSGDTLNQADAQKSESLSDIEITNLATTPVPAQNQPGWPPIVVSTYNIRRSLLLGCLLLLVALIGLLGWQRLSTQLTPTSILPEEADPPFFVDDFTNLGRWDLNEAIYAGLNQGRLWFNAPVNETGGWRSDVVNPQWNVEMPISRLRFTVGIEMPVDQTWGFLGVQTECYSERYADDDGGNDWLLVYIGGVERTVWLEYTPLEEQMPVQNFPLTPIVSSQPYTIDLIWTQPGVQIYLDGKPQGPVIPCLRPRQFNLNAGLDPGTQVQGYIDDVQVWN